MLSVDIGFYRFELCFALLFAIARCSLPPFPEPLLQKLSNVLEIGDRFPGVVLVGVVLPLNEVVWLVWMGT